MSAWRALLGLSIILLAGVGYAGEKFELKERLEPDHQWQTELDMRLTGTLEVRSGGKPLTFKLDAQARHQFPERVLNLDSAGLPTRIARHYDEAQATVTVQNEKTKHVLRADRRFQVAHQLKGETVTYSPSGPLTRDELELTGEHFNVLAIYGLLPTEAVAVGDAWKVRMPIAQALAGLDGIIRQDVQCKFDSVQGDVAKVSITGNLSGIADGAEAKVQVEGYFLFNLLTKHLTHLEWKQKDDRKPGPVSPGVKSEAVTTVKRTFGPPADVLSNAVVVTAPAEPNAGHLLLQFRDVKGRFEFLHDRGWHTVAQTEQYAVLRYLDRGELIAQVNINAWEKAKPGEHLNPDELRRLILGSPSLKVDQVLQSDTVPDDEGRWIYRLSIVAESEDIRILQNNYAVAGPQGDQVILIFTTEVPHADRLGERDLSIVGTISFPGAKKE